MESVSCRDVNACGSCTSSLRLEGLEPPTAGSVDRCSIQLSYRRWIGLPNATRRVWGPFSQCNRRRPALSTPYLPATGFPGSIAFRMKSSAARKSCPAGNKKITSRKCCYDKGFSLVRKKSACF
jgi:hypothetical protein